MNGAYFYVAVAIVSNLLAVDFMNRTYAAWNQGAPTWSWTMVLNYLGIAVPIVLTQFCLIFAKSALSLTGAIAVLIGAVLIGSMIMESWAGGKEVSKLQWTLAALLVLSVFAFLQSADTGDARQF